MSYRAKFDSDRSAAEYEFGEYGENTYASVLWEVEKFQLANLLDDFRLSHGRIDCLDFATGTGRVLEFLEGKVNSLTGIEISPAMAEIASRKVSQAHIICTDITARNVDLEGKYDLITAFRFFLNSEPELRARAFEALAKRLKDDGSWLVFNNHGNPCSHKLLMRPLHALRRNKIQAAYEGNYLAHREIMKSAEDAGLRIQSVIGCGILSSKVTRFMRFDTAVSAEKWLARSQLLSRLGVNQMYVAKLA